MANREDTIDQVIDADSTIHQHISVTLREAVGSASISPSGRDVCLAARKGLFIVDLDDPWQQPRLLPYASAIVADVQWSPHPSRAHWVVSTSGNKGLVWNLAASTSPIEHTCLGHERAITDMNWAVFQVDTLATCGIDGNVFVYDLRSGGSRPVSRYSGWRYGAAQVKYNRQNPNELASSHGEYLYIWDDRKGSAPMTKIRAHGQKIYGIDYSRKAANKIVTCSLDSTVKYWTLDGSPSIEEPDQVLKTTSPVWRARHTPFGDGLVTLPQRSDYEVKIWAQHAPEKEVFKLNGHRDVVREFLWRTKGGNDADDDDRVFQLVTWSSDNQLLLTPIAPSVCADVGHQPHSPIEVRHLRRNAENRSYRDILPSSVTVAAMAGSGISPTAYMGRSGDGSSGRSNGEKSRMTPPTLLSNQSHPSGRIALSSTTSRYRHSANSTKSASSAGASPIYGSSPVDSKGLSLSDRRSRHASALQQLGKTPNSDTQPAASKTAAFMTRAGGRKPDRQDAVEWMENVRIVSKGENDPILDTAATVEEGLLALAEGASTIGDRDIVPLHEELTAMARAFESKVRFEKISVPHRSVIAATYGPWARSGLPTLIRMTFDFPAQYPAKPVAVDIARSSHISNKTRAKLLSEVRGLAERYALKKRNSLEACLICLMRGEIMEPDDLDLDGDDDQAGKHLLIAGLAEDDIDDGSDDERTLANRNCPPPRRCGAVIAPNGTVYAFFPLETLSRRFATEKRARSLSPAGERQERRRRRRLFESFGVIPALQLSSRINLNKDTVGDVQEEDSDEALNIPSLLVTRRRASRGGGATASIDGTSQYTRGKLAGPNHSYNKRIYLQRIPKDVLDPSLSGRWLFRGDIEAFISDNSAIVSKSDRAPAVKRTWSTLHQFVRAAGSTDRTGMRSCIILGQKLAEKLLMDMLDVFYRLGDVETLGMLACLLELDRRRLVAASAHLPTEPPDSLTPPDYFSIKPRKTAASPRHSSTYDGRQSTTPSGMPLKSPTTWPVSTSYGTQNSSGGSKGSSWANHLSTFFKPNSSGTADRGTSTPPRPASRTGSASPGNLSPAFTRRSNAGTTTEVMRAGGIASGRPNIPKTRTATHVSFAASEDNKLGKLHLQIKPTTCRAKIVSHYVDPTTVIRKESLLLAEHVQVQLEFYRLLYANMLLRLDLPNQRVQVLKLTRSAADGTNNMLIRELCGIEDDAEKGVVLVAPCATCRSAPVKIDPSHCVRCKMRIKPLPCALCHLPLHGLTETCLSCLHTCHLACLQEWRREEESCPASCGCRCTAAISVRA